MTGGFSGAFAVGQDVVMEYSSLDSCRSADDTFCIYERYMRSFQRSEQGAELYEALPSEYQVMPSAATEEDLAPALDDHSLEQESLIDNDSSNKAAAASSDDTTRSDTSCRLPKPAIIASLVSMENSNNAVDGGRLFEPPSGEPVFKLPNNELTFNGTLKHLQKLKPIVDPMAAVNQTDYSELPIHFSPQRHPILNSQFASMDCVNKTEYTNGSETETFSEVNYTKESCFNWSGAETVAASAGRGSGESQSCGAAPGSPDVFSEEEEWSAPHSRLQEFLSQHETYNKILLRKMEKTLSGVLPPPSVTTLNIDVHEMLKKYYCYLPLFQDGSKPTTAATDATTPTKGTSYVQIPTEAVLPDELQEIAHDKPLDDKLETKSVSFSLMNNSGGNDTVVVDDVPNLNVSDPTGPIPEMGTEADAKQMMWPEILKCRFYDVHYNLGCYSEHVERAAMRVGQRFVGAEMSSTVTVFSGAAQSPTSAQKRKAIRVKMAQSKSPGRRLSHLARRRQAFCNAATFAERTQSTSSKMVLIDKKKLTHTSDRKSPRTKRTPGRKTPGKKTPGKKTPGKKVGGSSSKKKAMRRLVMDTETRSQPTRETSRRALFQSPDNVRAAEPPKTTNVRAMKLKRALFSPNDDRERTLDGASRESWGKRKRDSLEDSLDGGACKMQKSLSFGGEVPSQPPTTSLARRATEMFSGRRGSELNALQKQKLLWAVSNALRAHGWRMGAPGFKEKASSLAQLTRRLLTLPVHAARLAAAPSTSDYMLRLARKYVFSVIQGCSIEECYTEEQLSLGNETSTKLTGYVSVQAYQQMKSRSTLAANSSLSLSQTLSSSKIKENTCDSVTFKTEPSKSTTKNILQDKLVNIDSNSNSSGLSVTETVAIFKSNSMPSFKETAKLRARRQISFDNVDVPPKR